MKNNKAQGANGENDKISDKVIKLQKYNGDVVFDKEKIVEISAELADLEIEELKILKLRLMKDSSRNLYSIDMVIVLTLMTVILQTMNSWYDFIGVNGLYKFYISVAILIISIGILVYSILNIRIREYSSSNLAWKIEMIDNIIQEKKQEK